MEEWSQRQALLASSPDGSINDQLHVPPALPPGTELCYILNSWGKPQPGQLPSVVQPIALVALPSELHRLLPQDMSDNSLPLILLVLGV
jgi:hypothetical protein